MGVFDFLFGRKKSGPGKLDGLDGVISFNGWVQQDERHPDMAGTREQLTAFANSINDATIIAAAVRYCLALCAGTNWNLEENQDHPDGKRAAELIDSGLLNTKMSQPWETTIGQAATSPFYGFSLHEWCTTRRKRDGAIIVGDIECRPQWTIERWDKGDKGTEPLQGVVQNVPAMVTDPIYIPRNKLLYVVDRKLTTKPMGLGLLRHVIKKAARLEKYEDLEWIAFSNDLRGIPYAKAPYAAIRQYAKDNNKDEAWIKKQTETLRKFMEGHAKNPQLGIILDSDIYKDAAGNPTGVPKWALDLIKGDGGGLVEIAAAIERINREIARVLGMEFLLLGGDGKGSLALSRDKTSMFASLLASTLNLIAHAITYDIIWPLLSYNGLDPEECAPTLHPDAIADEAIESVTKALMDLASAGAPLMPGDPAIDQIRARLHLAAQPKLAPELLGALMRQKAGLGFGDPNDPNRDPNKGPPDPNDPNGGDPSKDPGKNPKDDPDAVDVDVSDLDDDDSNEKKDPPKEKPAKRRKAA